MAIRYILGTNQPKEVQKKVNGEFIQLIKDNISVVIPLIEWNNHGLDTMVNC